ncbi:MAG: hypothetical protein WCE75_12125 [Terracidiphilus sp.]
MGFIEEGRQPFQDFAAPDTSAIEARLEAVEHRLASLEAKMDRRIEGLEARIDRNQTQVMDSLHRMENYAQLLERLARLESKLQSTK